MIVIIAKCNTSVSSIPNDTMEEKKKQSMQLLLLSPDTTTDTTCTHRAIQNIYPIQSHRKTFHISEKPLRPPAISP